MEFFKLISTILITNGSNLIIYLVIRSVFGEESNISKVYGIFMIAIAILTCIISAVFFLHELFR